MTVLAEDPMLLAADNFEYFKSYNHPNHIHFVKIIYCRFFESMLSKIKLQSSSLKFLTVGIYIDRPLLSK